MILLTRGMPWRHGFIVVGQSVCLSVCLSVYSESIYSPGCDSTVFVPLIASTQHSFKFGC